MKTATTAKFYKEVGRRVKQARDQAKLTQEDLAARLSVTRTSITNIELGRQKVLFHTIVNLADALKVPIDSLVPPRGEASPDVNKILSLIEERPEPIQKWIRAALTTEER